MPSAIRCINCRLVFAVGWYHYSLGSHPYWAQTLCVCAACGTQHAVEHASVSVEKRDRLRYLPEPVIDGEEAPVLHDDDQAAIAVKWYVGLPPESIWIQVPEIRRKLTDLECMYCGQKRLTSTWETTAPCPGCGSRMETLSEWIT